MKSIKLITAAIAMTIAIMAVAAYTAPNPNPAPPPKQNPAPPPKQAPQGQPKLKENEAMKLFDSEGYRVIFYVKATPKEHLQFTKVTHEVSVFITVDKKLQADCKVAFELFSKGKSVYKGESKTRSGASGAMDHGRYVTEMKIASGDYDLKLQIVQGKKTLKLESPIKFP